MQIDGDGQHPPSEIVKLLNLISSSNCDICIGSRFICTEGFQSTTLRRVGINFINKLIFLVTNNTILDSTSGFRIINKRAIHLFSNHYPDKYPEPESIVLALLNGLIVKETQVEMKERKDGTSSIHGFYTIYYMLKVSLAILFLKLDYTLNKKRYVIYSNN